MITGGVVTPPGPVATAAGAVRMWTGDEVTGWLHGQRIGAATASIRPDRRRSRRELEPLRSVLVAPSLADACRTAILAAMSEAGIGVVEMADRSGRTRKAVSDALRYGRSGALSITMAE